MKNNKINIRDVSRIYSTEEMDTYAVKDANITVDDGEFILIAGPSGSGKSTLLSMMGLLDKPTSGEILIDGTNVASLNDNDAARFRNETIGFVFQSFNLINDLSIKDNVALPVRYSGQEFIAQNVYEKVEKVLDDVGLSHRLNHHPSQLSGGQQQRVAIARALVMEPSILLVDEPTGNLDTASGDAVISLLTELNRKGSTICMVTHDESYSRVASRTINMLDGIVTSEKGVSDI